MEALRRDERGIAVRKAAAFLDSPTSVQRARRSSAFFWRSSESAAMITALELVAVTSLLPPLLSLKTASLCGRGQTSGMG